MKPTDDLRDLSLSEPTVLKSNIFIDSASLRAILSTLAILAIFLIAEITTAAFGPSATSIIEKKFNVDDSGHNVSVDVDFTLTNLAPHHRYIDMTCAFVVRTRTVTPFEYCIHYAVRNTFWKNGTILRAVNIPAKSFWSHFLGAVRRSYQIPILRFDGIDFDAARFQLTLTAPVPDAQMLIFRWSFANPSVLKYGRLARFLLAVLMGYMTGIYISFLRFDADKFTEVFCLVIGALGVISWNPLSFGLETIVEHVFNAVYASAVRLFCLTQVYLGQTARKSPNPVVFASVCVAFAVYAIVEASASFDRARYLDGQSQGSRMNPPTANPMDLVHTVVGVGCVWWTIRALAHVGLGRARVNVFALFILILIPGTFFERVARAHRKDLSSMVMVDLSYTAVNMTTGAFAIFLLRTRPCQEYVCITTEKTEDLDSRHWVGDGVEEDGTGLQGDV
jgi:hypothetical protein